MIKVLVSYKGNFKHQLTFGHQFHRYFSQH